MIRKWRLARVALLAAVAALDVTAGVATGGARPVAATASCPDVMILGLRGHTDPLTVTDPNTGQAVNNMGDDVAALVDEITSMLFADGYSTAHDGVPYQDVPSLDLATGPANLRAATRQARFSIDVAKFRCPNSLLVLIGQSEGAGVLHQLIGSAPFDAAILLGDPLHEPDKPYNWAFPDGNNGTGLMLNLWRTTWALTGGIIFGAGQPPSPNPIQGPVESLCLPGDFVCGGGANPPEHTRYRFDDFGVLDAAADFVVNGNVLPELLARLNPTHPPLSVIMPELAPTVDAASDPPPPRPSDLFLYNPSSGASFVDMASGTGGWGGIKGPTFSPGWTIHTGDFNGGGLMDLFDYNASTGASFVDLANGSGGWTGIKGPTFSPGWQMYTGDFNGDGLTDLFDYNPSSGASFVDFANGSGGWIGVKGPTFSPGWSVFTGTFNRDGLTDLFLYNPSTGASFVDFANGSGGWTGVRGPTFSPGWTVHTGDFNGDGLTDVFDYNPTSGASFVDFADGSGGWRGVAGPTFSAGWQIFTGDFTGGALTDLFDYNPSTGASFVDLPDGAGGWRGVAGPTFSTGWKIFTGDFNADGLTDLFDYNPSTGASFVDFADGAGSWVGLAGPQFSAGWNVFVGRLK